MLGGGQLGKMFIQEAVNYNVQVCVLELDSKAPCALIAHEFICGDFNDYDTVIAFGKDKNVLTIEIEHVNTDALKQLDVKLFSHFPLLEELEVQYIVPLESGSGQGVQHLSPTQPLFKF